MLITRCFYRTLHTTLINLSRGRNPGVGRQVKTFDNAAELEEDPEGYGDLESDFMDVHKTHRQHEMEMRSQRERVRHLMVKHKYFREAKLPNFLTYGEKEQIKLLHSRDPDEWTAEKLAESFPATPEIVQKIIRAKWSARSVQRIKLHDAAVMQNWEKLRSNADELQIPAELRAHLLQFAARNVQDLPQYTDEWTPKVTIPIPRRKEFASIITSCKKYADDKTDNAKHKQALLPSGKGTFQQPKLANGDAETFLLDKVRDTRRMRFKELTELKLTPAEVAATKQQFSELSPTLHNPNGTGIVARELSAQVTGDLRFVEKFQSSEVIVSAEDCKRFDISRAKHQIYIPKKLRRKGATYRVEDSYYDDDGEFLYSVPGMTGNGSGQ